MRASQRDLLGMLISYNGAMDAKGSPDAPSPNGSAQFATTQWNVVLAAGAASNTDARDALEQLCTQYWYPLYAYVRRRVDDVDEAQDLTQAFVAHLLEKQTIGRADPNRGRFRAFLLTALKHFLANEREKTRAAKRGGKVAILSLDWEAGETRFQIEPSHSQTAEQLFERRWVLALLEQVVNQLRCEYGERGQETHFEQLKAALTGEMSAAQYELAARQLDISPAAAKQAAYRLRKRYREQLRRAVAQTIADERDVDDEIRRLFEALEN